MRENVLCACSVLARERIHIHDSMSMFISIALSLPLSRQSGVAVLASALTVAGYLHVGATSAGIIGFRDHFPDEAVDLVLQHVSRSRKSSSC